jgi:hypothetical protein
VVGFQQSTKAFNAGDLTTIVNLMHRFDYTKCDGIIVPGHYCNMLSLSGKKKN